MSVRRREGRTAGARETVGREIREGDVFRMVGRGGDVGPGKMAGIYHYFRPAQTYHNDSGSLLLGHMAGR